MGRETFSSRARLLATMIGVAVGLGNVWRFPYSASENKPFCDGTHARIGFEA